jgi:hypothetical protein
VILFYLGLVITAIDSDVDRKLAALPFDDDGFVVSSDVVARLEPGTGTTLDLVFDVE